MAAPCVYLWILRSFSEQLLYKTPPGDCLFHVPIAGFQPTYEKLISQVLFKHFLQEREVAIRRSSFDQNPWKLSVKKLIRSEVEKCKPPSLGKKHFYRYSLNFAMIFSKQITTISLEETLKVCHHTFRKCKRKVVLLATYLIHLSHPSSCTISHLTLTWVRVLPNKQFASLLFLQYLFVLHRIARIIARIFLILLSLCVLVRSFL